MRHSPARVDGGRLQRNDQPFAFGESALVRIECEKLPRRELTRGCDVEQVEAARAGARRVLQNEVFGSGECGLQIGCEDFPHALPKI